jgi:hypothetical protein
MHALINAANPHPQITLTFSPTYKLTPQITNMTVRCKTFLLLAINIRYKTSLLLAINIRYHQIKKYFCFTWGNLTNSNKKLLTKTYIYKK